MRLVELLDEAKARCKEQIVARKQQAGEEVRKIYSKPCQPSPQLELLNPGPSIHRQANEEEVEATASAMGYGAVKYADLKNHRMTDYKFSFESMLSMQGNTAVYLEYAHARISGISRKAR